MKEYAVANYDNIDNLIDEWHESEVNLTVKLHEYLGLTWDEWVNYGVSGDLPTRCIGDI